MKKFLFIHQNFPGQFVHSAMALAKEGHEVVAIGITGRSIPGVKFVRYKPHTVPEETTHSLLRDFETKLARGTACAQVMVKLKAQGFTPDTIVAHPGCGEPLFCKDVWPNARLIVFAEFFYGAEGADFAFDPEFSKDTVETRMRLRVKNSVHLHAFHDADAIYSPTHWQRSRLPFEYQTKTHVIFDGINTEIAKPNPATSILLKRDNLRIQAGDEIITFVNRNLEPYRGFHVFMRALPKILDARPHARCLIVGGDEVSYGSPPPNGKSWKDVLLTEVGSRLPMDRIHFLGKLDYRDYLRVLQVSRCHVYLTYPFVLSWSCLEAMSAGCTVVASRTQPVEEVIEHGTNGLLFDFFDTKTLTTQMVDVLQQPQHYSAIGKNARNTILERYDLKTRCLPLQTELIAGINHRSSVL